MLQIFTFLSVLFISAFAMAQEGKNPVEVTADHALEWNRANHTFSATGNAVITQGDNAITAPKIVADYIDGDSMIISKVTAAPNAILKQPNQTVSADTVVADFDQGLLSVVTADKNVVLKTDKETLYGDHAVYDAKTRIIIVTGDVRMEQDKNILTGNRAEFNLNTGVSTMTALPSKGGRVRAIFYNEGSQ